MTLDAGGPGSRLQALRAGLTDNYGLIWTVGILLRIRRSQPQVKRHRLSAATFVDVAMEATVAGHGCRLVLRVSAYEWPDEVSGSDANWLTGEVELQAGRTGVFHACHG